MAASIESETTGGSDGKSNVDADGTVSSGNANSTQVDNVRLAGDVGQHECPNGETKWSIPVSLGHSSNPQRIRTASLDGRRSARTRHDLLYLGYAHAVQSPRNRSKHTCSH